MWIREKKRRVVQLVCAVLYNCNIGGFAAGEIYKGNLKSVCVPGLNCYSCPGAVASCPLGSLQTALVSSRYKRPYYVLGLLLLFGVILGRTVCGWFCPFGFLQELLYKIPGKKLRKNRLTRRLTWVKYGILAVFVIGIPLTLLAPGFCKYICPAGTLEGGIFLVWKNEKLRALAGGLFGWKLFLLLAVLVSCVFIFRSFCRFICPLGAFYSLFCRISSVGFTVDEGKCDGCGACVHACRMDVRRVGDRECIHCGKCKETCPRGAIRRRAAKPKRAASH